MMRTIMILNTKGGCGKSTLATNLASYYATEDKAVSLIDFDPQGSSTAWLAVRPEERPQIHGVAAWREPVRLPEETEVVVMDVPAAMDCRRLRDIVAYAQSVVIPVLPSSLDINAARNLVGELKVIGAVRYKDVRRSTAGIAGLLAAIFGGSEKTAARLAVIANRVREHTLAYEALDEFLTRLKVPFVTSLRDTQNYVQAAERGLGIFELAPSQVWADLEQWEPLTKWLRSKRSLPKPAAG